MLSNPVLFSTAVAVTASRTQLFEAHLTAVESGAALACCWRIASIICCCHCCSWRISCCCSAACWSSRVLAPLLSASVSLPWLRAIPCAMPVFLSQPIRSSSPQEPIECKCTCGLWRVSQCEGVLVRPVNSHEHTTPYHPLHTNTSREMSVHTELTFGQNRKSTFDLGFLVSQSSQSSTGTF